MPHVHLNREIDLHEIIRRFARLDFRDLRRMELTNIQTPRKGDLGPELKSIKRPRGARILSNDCSSPSPPLTHTVSNKKNIAQSQGVLPYSGLYRYVPLRRVWFSSSFILWDMVGKSRISV